MLRPILAATTLAVLFFAATPSASADASAQAALEKRQATVRFRGKFFSKIAVDRDYSGEWVIARTAKTTTFLDIADPRHPRTRANGPGDGTEIHLLVVPNQAREHIAKSLGDRITEADVKATLDVFREAKKTAKRLGINKARIYANSESRVGVGYLHVHIQGQLPPKKALPRLKK